MNGIIIVNQTIGHNQYKIDRFKTEFSKKGVHLDVFVNDGTLAEIKNNEIKINLPAANFVLYLDKDIYLARLLEDVQIYRGYWMLTWFSREFAHELVNEAKIQEMAVEEILNSKLWTIPPGSDGLVLQPLC